MRGGEGVHDAPFDTATHTLRPVNVFEAVAARGYVVKMQAVVKPPLANVKVRVVRIRCVNFERLCLTK